MPLPWWSAFPDLWQLDWPAFLLVQLAVLLVAGLGRSIPYFIRHGAWVLSLLLALLLLAVLALSGGLVWLRYEGRFPEAFNVLLMFVLLGLPALVFVGRLIVWGVQGRWRRVGLLLLGSVLLGVPLAALWFWIDAPNLGPTRHYTADGWNAVGFVGAYAPGALLALGWLLRAAYRAVRRIRFSR
jgi:hypothetical protein